MRGEHDRESGKSFEQLLAERGCTMSSISGWPDDLEVTERTRRFTPLSRIDIPGVGSYIIIDKGNGVLGGQTYFGEKESAGSSSAHSMEKLYPEILRTIDSNLRGIREKEEGQKELDSLIKELGGNVTEITDFPDDLDDGGRAHYMTRRDIKQFGYLGASLLRIDFPNGTTVLMIKPQGRYYYAGSYKNGVYSGGNHDFNISELRRNIQR